MAHLRDEGSPGRPGYPVLVLFRALLLQSLYGLSERELEEALGDRLSFKRFVGLSLEDATPDHTVLNRFRNQLVEQGLLEKLFGELDRQLENAGVILKRGTKLDATLIQAVSGPPTEERASNDPDARFTRRQGKSGTTTSTGGDHLRHSQTAHAADLHPLCRPRQGKRADPARLHRIQHETVGRDRGLSRPPRAPTTPCRLTIPTTGSPCDCRGIKSQ